MIPQTLDPAIERVAELITTHFGHSTSVDWVEMSLRSFAMSRPELGLDDARSVAKWVLDAFEERAGTITGCGVTCFFRDPPLFRVLEKVVLPKLIASRRNGDRHLKIWSAGCSIGCEPYSIAMTLLKVLPDPSSWKISILGTDINREALQIGKRGAYGELFGELVAPSVLSIIDHYFSQQRIALFGGRIFTVKPAVRRMVRFKYLNLARDRFPRKLDIIFCQNTLMYLDESLRWPIIRKFVDSLVEGGLLVGPYLFPGANEPRLVEEQIWDVTMFRKRGGACQ